MQVVIIAGSNRRPSNSRKVSDFIAAKAAQGGFTDAHVIDLHETVLPLWDESVWTGEGAWKAVWLPVRDKLQAADALVLVAPEWAGMVPAHLKNLLLYCSNKELAHKPAMIAGVSSGMGGAYPVSELRISGWKNNRLLFVPDHVIIRDANNLLNGDTPQSKIDEDVRARVVYSVRMLGEYAKAMRLVRASGVPDYKTYPFGQ
jgi:NAD(P)H-dependent FMN reductase